MGAAKRVATVITIIGAILSVAILLTVGMLSQMPYELFYQNTEEIDKYRIFQIGFNRCGTLTLSNFFAKNKIRSIHYGGKPNGKRLTLSKSMYRYHNTTQKLLTDWIDKYQYFGDFGTFCINNQNEDLQCVNRTYKICESWFELIDEEYRSDYKLFYILNIRNVDHWIKSRYMHHVNKEKNGKNWTLKQMARNWYDMDEYGSDEIILFILKMWKILWYQYMCNVLNYFHKNNTMSKLLIFDIEEDEPNKLVEFFANHGIHLNVTFYTKLHKTQNKDNWRKFEIHVAYNHSDKLMSEYERILDKCNNL
eukprot:352216_1